MYLPNPDPILKAQGRDIRIYRELRTDPLVGGCIRRRKAALKSLERGLERGHASARVFRFIRDMLDDLDLSRIIGEMSDAVLYGYQPCEIMWGRSVRSWAVTDIVGKPPEWFQFDTDNCLRFRARDAGVEGELLSPSKFVVPAQDASYDNPYGFPDLSMCFWPVAFKKGGMKFWLRFAEKFGSPWVIGKHPRGANDAEIEKLLDSMEQMVEDAVAAIPDDSSIELRAADGKADSSEVFRELITLSRSEISIALLGQNQTTEANSNKASAQAGLEVTADIRDADADIIQAAVNQVIRTVVTLNFGDVPCPVWAMWEQEAIDDTRATRDEKLTRAGLRPNLMTMGAGVMALLKFHPAIQAAIGANERKRITTEILQDLFQIEEIVIGAPVSLPSMKAAMDKNSVPADIWGDNLMLHYVGKPQPGADSADENEPSFGYTLRRKGMPVADKYDGAGGKVKYCRYTDIYKVAVVGGDAGYLITGISK
ncbi:TPA: DUF935 domain-containing protein [Escherichia coli]